MSVEEPIRIDGRVRQMIQFSCGKFVANSGNTSLIELVRAINMLRGVLKEDILKEALKEEFEPCMKRYAEFCKIVAIIEAHLHGITTRQINTEDLSSARYRRYCLATMALPFYEVSAFRFFAILAEKANLPPIPRTDFTLINRENVRLDFWEVKDEEERKKMQSKENEGEE